MKISSQTFSASDVLIDQSVTIFKVSCLVSALTKFPRGSHLCNENRHFFINQTFQIIFFFFAHSTGKKQLIAASSSPYTIKKENFTSQQVSSLTSSLIADSSSKTFFLIRTRHSLNLKHSTCIKQYNLQLQSLRPADIITL